MKRLGGLLLVLGLGLPVAFGLTLVAWPFWGWFEARTGIESLGHSGPADWCFWFVYALCVLGGLAVLVKRWRRGRPPINPP